MSLTTSWGLFRHDWGDLQAPDYRVCDLRPAHLHGDLQSDGCGGRRDLSLNLVRHQSPLLLVLVVVLHLVGGGGYGRHM